MRAAYFTHVDYINIMYSLQPTLAMILFAAKSEKTFQDTIMAEQVPCFQLGFDFLDIENSDDFEESLEEVASNFNNYNVDLHLLKVALIFWSKILLMQCVDYFIKGIKDCSSCIVEL